MELCFVSFRFKLNISKNERVRLRLRQFHFDTIIQIKTFFLPSFLINSKLEQTNLIKLELGDRKKIVYETAKSTILSPIARNSTPS